jgi:hypothetical protein
MSKKPEALSTLCGKQIIAKSQAYLYLAFGLDKLKKHQQSPFWGSHTSNIVGVLNQIIVIN